MRIRSNISSRIAECGAPLIEVRGKQCMNTLRIHGSIAAKAEAHIEDEHRDL